MEIKVAITSQNKKTVFEHAGKCTSFLVYHLKNNELIGKSTIEISKDECLHNYFHNDPSENVMVNPLAGVNMLLTGGIGDGAIKKLANEGIATHLIEETDADLAIKKLLNGTLAAKRTGNCNCSCGGGDHDHKHEHGHSHH